MKPSLKRSRSELEVSAALSARAGLSMPAEAAAAAAAAALASSQPLGRLLARGRRPTAKVSFLRRLFTICGRADAVDRTPHDLPCTCDAEGCERFIVQAGRYHCPACGDFDVCTECWDKWNATGRKGWPHAHGRSQFVRFSEEEVEEEECGAAQATEQTPEEAAVEKECPTVGGNLEPVGPPLVGRPEAELTPAECPAHGSVVPPAAPDATLGICVVTG